MSASGGMSSMSCTPENSCIRPAHDMNIFREAVVQLTRRNYGLPGSGLSARVRWSGVRNTIHTSGPNLYPRVVQVLGRGLAAPNKAGRIVCKHSYPHARFIDNLPTVRSYNSHLRTMAGISC